MFLIKKTENVSFVFACMASIVVVGSCSVDLFVVADRLPRLGETVLGSSFLKAYGGKGANQAVQAALLGSSVAFVGAVGPTDSDGIVANFAARGVDASHVQHTTEPCGVALIEVEKSSGGNRIVVCPNANALVTEHRVAQAERLIAAAGFLVCQLEIPVAATLAALRLARQLNVRTVLNPSPVPADVALIVSALPSVDYLIVNETEAAELAQQGRVTTPEDATAAAKTLLVKGVRKAVVVTLGERGGVVVEQSGVVTAFSCPKVDVRDTTGAGDSFLGAFVHFLLAGQSEGEAAKVAARVASYSCEKPGCQPSYLDSKQFAEREEKEKQKE